MAPSEPQHPDDAPDEELAKPSTPTKAKQAAGERRASVYAGLSYGPNLRIRLYSPPRQRQKWGSDQVLPHVNWGDLFFDLFYVAGFYNLGNILVDDPSPIGLLYFLGCFFPLLKLWTDKMWYDSRFVTGDDIFHRAFEVLVLVTIATTVSYISPTVMASDPSGSVEMFGFAASVCGASLLDMVRVAETRLFGRGQRGVIRTSAVRDLLWKSLPLAFYVAAAAFAGANHFGGGASSASSSGYDESEPTKDYGYDGRRDLAAAYPAEDSKYEYAASGCEGGYHVPIILMLAGWAVAQLHMVVTIRFCFPNDGSHKRYIIPMNIDFTIHRQGEFTMLVLGESILSLLIVDGDSDRDYYSAFYCGIVTVILVQYLHFRSQPRDADAHAMRRHKDAGVLFGQTFGVYSAALIAVGASFKMFMYDFAEGGGGSSGRRSLAAKGGASCGPTGDEKEQNVAYLFSVALAVVFVCTDVMNLAHVGLKKQMAKCNGGGGRCPDTGRRVPEFLRWRGLAVVGFRGGLTAFAATLGLWLTDPRTLSEVGLAVVVGQLINRFLGDAIFPEPTPPPGLHGHGHHGGHGHHDHHREGLSDDEEEYVHKYDDEGSDDDDDEEDDFEVGARGDDVARWPNVTQAQVNVPRRT